MDFGIRFNSVWKPYIFLLRLAAVQWKQIINLNENLTINFMMRAKTNSLEQSFVYYLLLLKQHPYIQRK